MKILLSFALFCLFTCNNVNAEWNKLTCQVKCTAKYCADLEQGKKCIENCNTNIRNCTEAYNKTKQLKENEKSSQLKPGECINCHIQTEGGTEPGEPVTRHKVCDCKNPDGTTSQKKEALLSSNK